MQTIQCRGWVRIPAGGTITTLQRIGYGPNYTLITRAAVESVSYSVVLLGVYSNTPVMGHTAVAVPVAGAVFDAVQTSADWTNSGGDSSGYNFRWEIDTTAAEAFATPGHYLVTWIVTPAGAPALVWETEVEAY
jgi:hypothetical protein